MTDHVRLFIDSSRKSGCPVPPYCEITPDIALQIVALTDLPARLAALEAHAHCVLDLNRRHLRGLIPIAAARGEVEAECDRMGLPPLAVAGITGGSVGAQPAGGSALEARPSPGDDGMAVHSFTREGFEQQRKFIAALRAEIAAWPPAHRALIAERDRLRRDLLDIAEGCRVGVADEAEAKRRIIAIAGERDRLAAQVASLVGPDGRNYCATVEAERDKALADLKEAKLDVIRAVAEWAGMHVGNYREMVAARADADAMAGLLSKIRDERSIYRLSLQDFAEIGAALAKHTEGKK